MGRQRNTKQEQPPQQDDAHFSFTRDDAGGVTVMRDGHPQSHVMPDDPTHIEFEYVQHLALVIDTLSPGALGITHIGGAGLTLARYIEATRPGSAQIVLEPDAALTEAVRRELPLPRGHRIRVRGTDGATGIAALKDASADVIVLDAFDEGRVPADLVTEEFAQQVARVLKPSGIFLANLADEPGWAWASRAMATIDSVLPSMIAICANDVAKGRRYGNIVLVAARDESAFDAAAIKRAVAKCMFPTTMRSAAELRSSLTSAKSFGVAGESSPPPPDFGSWRVR